MSSEGATLQSMAMEQLNDQMRALEIQLQVHPPSVIPFHPTLIAHDASRTVVGCLGCCSSGVLTAPCVPSIRPTGDAGGHVVRR